MRPKLIAENGTERKSRRKSAVAATPRPDPWYKRYPLDYHRGTRTLSIAARGAYSDILDMMYMEGGALKDDDFQIACSLRIKMRVWLRLREELFSSGKLFTRKGFLINKRAEEELNERKIARKVKPSRIARVKLLQGKPKDINGGVTAEPEAEPDTDIDRKKEEHASYDAASLRADDSFISDLTKWHPSGDESQARGWLNTHLDRYGEGLVRAAYNQLLLDFADNKVKQKARPLGLFSSIVERMYRNGDKPKRKETTRQDKFAAMRRANGEKL